jgi:hypothetical protein
MIRTPMPINQCSLFHHCKVDKRLSGGKKPSAPASDVAEDFTTDIIEEGEGENETSPPPPGVTNTIPPAATITNEIPLTKSKGLKRKMAPKESSAIPQEREKKRKPEIVNALAFESKEQPIYNHLMKIKTLFTEVWEPEITSPFIASIYTTWLGKKEKAKGGGVLPIEKVPLEFMGITQIEKDGIPFFEFAHQDPIGMVRLNVLSVCSAYHFFFNPSAEWMYTNENAAPSSASALTLSKACRKQTNLHMLNWVSKALMIEEVVSLAAELVITVLLGRGDHLHKEDETCDFKTLEKYEKCKKTGSYMNHMAHELSRLKKSTRHTFSETLNRLVEMGNRSLEDMNDCLRHFFAIICLIIPSSPSLLRPLLTHSNYLIETFKEATAKLDSQAHFPLFIKYPWVGSSARTLLILFHQIKTKGK